MLSASHRKEINELANRIAGYANISYIEKGTFSDMDLPCQPRGLTFISTITPNFKFGFEKTDKRVGVKIGFLELAILFYNYRLGLAYYEMQNIMLDRIHNYGTSSTRPLLAKMVQDKTGKVKHVVMEGGEKVYPRSSKKKIKSKRS